LRRGALITILILFGSSSTLQSGEAPTQRGVCFVAGPRRFQADAFEQLARLSVNWISVTPFGWLGRNRSTVQTRTRNVWWGESDSGLKATFRGAREKNIKVLLNPHIWMRPGKEGEWRGSIGFDTEAEWNEWEGSYHRFMMHYARLAEEEQVEALCIGTELRSTVKARPEFWHSLIDSVREVYGGRLTYAANWYREFEEVPFWGALDFVGIQGYFPLAVEGDSVTVEGLMEGWSPHLDRLEAFQKRVGKPVVFTEVGYRSTNDAAVEPWLWRSEGATDTHVQALCYEAMFRVFWTRPWFAGSYIWKWYPYPPRRPGRRERDFTPQGKPSEGVLSRWYGGSAAPGAVE
jgi:hypothetical protein